MDTDKITTVMVNGSAKVIKDLPIEVLADAFGESRSITSMAEDIQEALGKEVKRRRRKKLFGSLFTLSVISSSTSRLDRPALKELLGDALEKYVKTSSYTKILCTARQSKGRAA